MNKVFEKAFISSFLSVLTAAFSAQAAMASAVDLSAEHRVQESVNDELIAYGILSEYQRLMRMVSNLQSDGTIDGTTVYKQFGDTVLIWNTRETNPHASYNTIRIQRDRPDGTTLDISYHGDATHIVEGRRVLRRFVGTFQRDFRNDTIDLETQEYLGAQGVRVPRLDARDREILREWSIVLYP
jgi:hypothetical protein